MSVYFNYGLSQNRIFILKTERVMIVWSGFSLKKWSVLVSMVSSMNSLFSSLFIVCWCGRLVGEDLVEDYNAFRVERRGGGSVVADRL